MPQSDLSVKLRLKDGQRALLIDPPAGYAARLAPLPEGAALVGESAAPDFVQAFVGSAAALATIASRLAEAARSGAIVWVSYPKKRAGVATDITRDAGWEPLLDAGLRPVSQISVDETWSALRFRPTEAVGSPFPRR